MPAKPRAPSSRNAPRSFMGGETNRASRERKESASARREAEGNVTVLVMDNLQADT
jgi:hypothetical protein